MNKHNFFSKTAKQTAAGDYGLVRAKLFRRTLLLMLGAVLGVVALYGFVLYGHVADFVIAVLQRLFGMEYTEAYDFYRFRIRGYGELVMFGAMSLTFFISFRIYLGWFTRYFEQINRGIDALLQDGGGEVHLPPELVATEKKINTIKHTLETRKLDAQLAEQRKNDLVVYLAHDLKTPLTSVIGYLTLLRDEGQISEELRQKYLSISLDKAERLEDLINEFFEITRFNLSDITLQYSRVNLTRLLQQLVFEFAPMLAEKQLHCTLDAPPELLLRGDADKLQRVLDNLLRNAVFYSYPGTDIRILVTQTEDAASIRFCNKGDTIPPEKLDRVFEQFYRLDTARSSNSGGAGLGLAIARHLVTLHHGSITAHSAEEEIEFTVALPLAPPAPVGKS